MTSLRSAVRELTGTDEFTYVLAVTRLGTGGSADTTVWKEHPVVGANLRRLRVRRGLSLEKLSKLSNVSRAMLGQIELGQSAPTINAPESGQG